jgi:hypothetical protein
VFFAEIPRGAESARAYLVADAWDGAEIRASLERFLEMAGGRATETVSVRRSETQLALAAGGAAHVTVFVGHNGLMDFSLPPPGAAQRETPSSSIVLACASKSYFLERLRSAGSHPLLLTTGLMAPEAYTLDAALRAWIGAGSAASAREAAAVAYDRYQKCGPRAARRLFWSED